MLCKRVIARLDVKPSLGCVKGCRYEGLRVVGDPAELAARYEAQGADEVLVLDTTASLYGRRPDLALIRRINAAVYIPLTYGGGVQSVEDVRAILRAGAEKVAVNTAAFACEGLAGRIARSFGAQAMVGMVEVKTRPISGSWTAYARAGRDPGHPDAVAWAVRLAEDAGELVATSVDRDGTRQGLDHEFLAALRPKVGVPVVLSGGARDAGDVAAALTAGASGVAVASLLHAGVGVGAIKDAMRAEGLEVRG